MFTDIQHRQIKLGLIAYYVWWLLASNADSFFVVYLMHLQTLDKESWRNWKEQTVSDDWEFSSCNDFCGNWMENSLNTNMLYVDNWEFLIEEDQCRNWMEH